MSEATTQNRPIVILACQVFQHWLEQLLPNRFDTNLIFFDYGQELGTYRPQAQEVAAYCARWGMRYEEILGTDNYLRRLVEIAIGLDQTGDEFLLIPPGGMLTQAHFIR